MPRKYEKKSLYWKERAENANKNKQASQISQIIQTTSQLNSQIENFSIADIEYQDISLAHNTNDYLRTSTSRFSSSVVNSKYPNVSKGIFPYEARGDIVTATDAIKLCQLLYANVAICRNTIDTLCEFSSNQIHVKTSNESVKKFFTKWFKKINLWKLQDEFFREYYRSGNVFIYKFNGKFDSESFNALKSIFALKSDNIPLAYTILNPAEIGVESSPLGYGDYVKMLSIRELQKLLNSNKREDIEFVNKIDKDILKEVKSSGYKKELYVLIDPERLSCVFYKKQAYEPMSIPMMYPILDDVEWKLSLKNMDKVLTKCVDNIILLITMGAKKDDGGINYKNIARVQEMFQNQAAGRVIVSDYTTEAEFVVPNFEKILGPDKYQIVDRDIKEGLQNILASSSEGEKFSNLAIKVKVFLERLKEGQKAFINWLSNEVTGISETMNFKNVPELEMEEVDLEDPNIIQKTFIRLYELGLFTPEDLIEAFKTKMLPDPKTLLTKQKEFRDQKLDRLWMPLLGGSNIIDDQNNGRPPGTKSPKESSKPGVRKSLSNLNIAIDDIALSFKKYNKLEEKCADLAKQKYGIKELTKEQERVIEEAALNIFSHYDEKEWEDQLHKIDNSELENTNIYNDILEWAEESGLDILNASILYHSNKKI